ncbi:hypothetical protein BJF79_29555 [Actinomadura sp. CNU-125]|uniref:N-6 DNA methylase n=1 Tax=Actinomadura sp. CNU-125 TaxID=1904961 RepID=UPI0009644DAC|nr:N-6 DNA methylase [Actinomadura sp. CNU-125]OLT37382.1 hypothetical protein BJF79_29555 [Actinomadura sp. CNU-125]
MAGVRRETVTTWAKRHADFPAPRPSGGAELFDLGSVVRWLGPRRVPTKSLRDGEPEGTTYADRVRRAMRGREPREVPVASDDAERAREIVNELYGPLADRVRGGGSDTAYLHLLTALVFVRRCSPGAWSHVRDLEAEAARDQPAPDRVLKDLGTLIDAEVRRHGLPPGMAAACADLRPEDTGDLAHVLRRCEELGREGYRLLLDGFEARTKRSGEELHTPRGIVRMMADVLLRDTAPGLRCHDPYLRGGEALVAAVEAGGDVRVSGDGSGPDSFRLAGMNLALHGTRAVLGPGTATPWTDGEERQFDRIITNPPFNRKGRNWSHRAWPFGTPPTKNDNYAWLQHIVASLGSGGRAAVVMPNAAAVSPDAKERAIRAAMIEEGVVECVVWLPGKLFRETSIAVTVWFLAAPGTRSGPVLLVDARRMGESRGRQRFLADRERAAIVACHRSWTNGERGYADPLEGIGTAVSAPVERLRDGAYSLDPSEYAETASGGPGAAEQIAELADVLEEAHARAAGADELVASMQVLEREPLGAPPSGGWPVVRLGDLCDLRSGPSNKRLKKFGRCEDGVPLIVPRHLRDRRVVATDPERLTPEAARELDRFTRKDDVLFVRTGSPGSAALVGPEQADWVFATNLMRLRRKPSAELDPAYLLAFLTLPRTVRWIKDRAATATVIGSVSTRTLGDLRIPLPPFAEQTRIGTALHALDVQLHAHRALAETVGRTRAALAADLIPTR